MPFAHKYKPKKTSEILGQDAQIKELKLKLNSLKKKGLLIYGPTGTGKTSSIHALAEELDLEIIEVNASDLRNSNALEEKILPAIKQQSLFSKSKIILIDEIDGLSGTDRGGLTSIIKFIDESKYPIILTANDIWDNKFNPLRKKCVMIEYKALNFLTTSNHLKDIAQKEKIDIDEDALNYIARVSHGDLRSALIDMENVSIGRKKVTKKEVEILADREREESIVNALLKVFKTTNPEIALGAFDNVDEDIGKIFLWLDENLPKEYKDLEALSKAYDVMSIADVFFGRIRRWQYYRYYVYIYNLLTAGIAIAKKEKNPDFVQYGPSGRILKIWIANQKNAKRKAIAAKIASKVHTSSRQMFANMPYIISMMKNEEMNSKIVKEFELNEEEVEWLER
jgi:replication factor C large subunit